MNEAWLWQFIKAGLEAVDVEIQRIESGATSKGIFDINALYKGTEIWIELKFARAMIRREQKAWAVRRLRAGGRLWIISSGGHALEVWNAQDAIINQSYPKRPSHLFTRPIQWHQVRDTLFGGKTIGENTASLRRVNAL